MQIIKEKLDITEQEIPSKDYKSSLPMTFESAFYELGQSINENPEFAEELKAALSEKEEFKRKTDLLEGKAFFGQYLSFRFKARNLQLVQIYVLLQIRA